MCINNYMISEENIKIRQAVFQTLTILIKFLSFMCIEHVLFNPDRHSHTLTINDPIVGSNK